MNVSSEPWKVEQNTMTGGRIKQAQPFINNETFMLTYGDGVSNINIEELVKFHKAHSRLITMTSAQPDGRFGALKIGSNNQILEFQKNQRVMVVG